MTAYREAPLRLVCVTCGRDDATRQCARCGVPVCDRDLLSPRDFCEGCEQQYAVAVHKAELDHAPVYALFGPYLLANLGCLLGIAFLSANLILGSAALGLLGGTFQMVRHRRARRREIARAARLTTGSRHARPPGQPAPR